MGIFGGNGFQGPGEEFGNSWDAFKTGRGNFMTGGRNERNVSGPMQNSPVPGMRPDPAVVQDGGFFDGLFKRRERKPERSLPGILGLLELLTQGRG